MKRFIIKHEENESPRVAGIYNGILPEGERYFVGFSTEEIKGKDFQYLKAEFAEPDYIVTYDIEKVKARDRIKIGEPKLIACQRILKYINGLNDEKDISSPQAQSTANLFGPIVIQLLSGGINTSKLMIEGANLNGTFYDDTDRTEIISFIDWEISKLN